MSCDREQELLLPPSLRAWLSAIYGDYCDDGRGRAAHDPAMMVALLLYSYAIGERTSRRIERRCQEDVAFRVISRPSLLALHRTRHLPGPP